jgi:molecular chaperone DnaK
MSVARAVGIDLGTTYSKIAYLDDRGRPTIIPHLDGSRHTPSVVLIKPDGVLVGEPALAECNSHPQLLVQNVKQFIAQPNKLLPEGNPVHTSIEVASFLFQSLKRDAEARLKMEVRQAVLTVPVSFGDPARRATAQAAEMAGIEVIDIIDEPVAAALYHWVGDEELGVHYHALGEHSLILVFDLGGGTLDLSVVNYEPDKMRQVASEGDPKLGGNAWTERLADHVGTRIWSLISDRRGIMPARHDLVVLAEAAKRSLTDRDVVDVLFPRDGPQQRITVARKRFAELCDDLVKRAEQITSRLIKQGIKHGQVNDILVTGGASRMPMIRTMLEGLTGKPRCCFADRPEEWVALGAALQAGIHLSTRGAVPFSRRLSRLEQIRVCPHSLGVLAWSIDGRELRNEIVIPRNTELPVRVSKVFGTTKPNQRKVAIRVVEGDSQDQSRLRGVGICRIAGLQENLPTDSPIEVNFEYDTSARLHVSAKEPASGKLAEVTFDRGVATPTAAWPVVENAMGSPASARELVELRTLVATERSARHDLEARLQRELALRQAAESRLERLRAQVVESHRERNNSENEVLQERLQREQALRQSAESRSEQLREQLIESQRERTKLESELSDLQKRPVVGPLRVADAGDLGRDLSDVRNQLAIEHSQRVEIEKRLEHEHKHRLSAESTLEQTKNQFVESERQRNELHRLLRAERDGRAYSETAIQQLRLQVQEFQKQLHDSEILLEMERAITVSIDKIKAQARLDSDRLNREVAVRTEQISSLEADVSGRKEAAERLRAEKESAEEVFEMERRERKRAEQFLEQLSPVLDDPSLEPHEKLAEARKKLADWKQQPPTRGTREDELDEENLFELEEKPVEWS